MPVSSSVSKSGRLEQAALVVILLVLAVVRLSGIYSRAIDYREALTLLETSGHMDPVWPSEPAPVLASKSQIQGATIQNRRSLEHPWLHPWLVSVWRQWAGDSLEAIRILSLPFSLIALAALYALLRAADFEFPLIPVWFFGLTLNSVHQAQEATDYAVASGLTGAATLGAFLAAGAESGRRLWGYSLATGLCAALALNASYITLFPAGVILLWLAGSIWRVSRVAALLPCVVVTGGFVVAVLERYASGMWGPPGAITVARAFFTLVRMNFFSLYTPAYLPMPAAMLVWVLLLALFVWSILVIRRQWPRSGRGLLVLLIGVGLSCSAGVFLLNVVFGKHFMEPRYLLFSAPAVAVLVSYALVRLLAARRAAGLAVLVMVTAIQLTGINWGQEKAPAFVRGSRIRSLARAVERGGSASQIVVAPTGKGRGGIPAMVAYELPASAQWLVLDEDADVSRVASALEPYELVWVVSSFEWQTAAVEKALRERLGEQGRKREQYELQEWELWRLSQPGAPGSPSAASK